MVGFVETLLLKKSALALLKIHQLIEVGYGGNVSTSKKLHILGNTYYNIDINDDGFIVCNKALSINHVSFNTKEQAEEFLKYPENVELLKDYFMI